jgi:hypothetical protein
MRTNPNPCVVFSAFKSNKSLDDNQADTIVACAELIRRDIPLKIVKGCYKGEQETSILVNLVHFDVVLALAKRFGQESILVVDTERNAKLVFCKDESTQVLGKWAQAFPPYQEDAYTLDPETNIYWHCA